jgi:hypothetical protein
MSEVLVDAGGGQCHRHIRRVLSKPIYSGPSTDLATTWEADRVPLLSYQVTKAGFVPVKLPLSYHGDAKCWRLPVGSSDIDD